MAEHQKDTGRRVLFSAQKNEGPFILEWVAYHKVIGFTDIIVVSNDCDDGGDDLLDRLSDAGEILHFRQDVPPDASAQLSAARLSADNGVFRSGDWVMWLDLDEFLVISPPRKSLPDLIDALGDADALFVAWRYFGDNGHATWPGRHVSRDFTRAARRTRGRSSEGKVLFRNDERVERMNIHRPILASGIGPETYRIRTSADAPAPPAMYDPQTRNRDLRLADEGRPYRLAQIAHFSVRTPDMFARKDRRGDGYFARDTKQVARNARMYRTRNLNEVEEPALAEWEENTTAEMERLIALPGIEDCTKRIEGFRLKGPDLSVPLLYWSGKRNFGDLIGPMIVSGLTGRETRPVRDDDTQVLTSVGSIIHLIKRPGAVIWGSGLLGPVTPPLRARFRNCPPAKILAVRGKLTRRELEDNAGLHCPESYGDPALLLPRILARPDPHGKLVICPHWQHRTRFTVDDPGIAVADVRRPPAEVIRLLAGASAVVSSSLHGLIVAQAYGVPWLWLRENERPLDGSDFKFNDFFSTLDIEAEAVPSISFQAGKGVHAGLAEAEAKAICPKLAIDIDSLAASLINHFSQTDCPAQDL